MSTEIALHRLEREVCALTEEVQGLKTLIVDAFASQEGKSRYRLRTLLRELAQVGFADRARLRRDLAARLGGAGQVDKALDFAVRHHLVTMAYDRTSYVVTGTGLIWAGVTPATRDRILLHEVAPDAICGNCGHRADEHQTYLPAACRAGCTLSQEDIIDRLNQGEDVTKDPAYGCHCLGWTPKLDEAAQKEQGKKTKGKGSRAGRST